MNHLKIRAKYFDYLAALTAYLIIALLVLGGIVLSPGTIGFFHDWFIGPFSEMNQFWAKNGLFVWDSQIGNKLYDTDWIFRLSILPLAFLGGELVSKGLLIVILTLSGFASFCLGKQLKLSPYVSFAAGILYIFSPIIFTRIAAGYIYYLVAYALSPIILQSFLKGKDENKKKYFVIAALLLSYAVIQIQFLLMIFIILVIFSLIDFKRIKKSIIGLFIIFSITILITFSPILLAQLSIKNAQIPFNPTQLLSYFTVTSASDLAKSFRLLGYESMPYSYLNLGTSKDLLVSNAGIMPSWIFYLDFILPIVGFSVLLFRRDKYTISLAIISIIGLFLLKGTNPPLPGVFVFLFTHGFYIFREVWHIAFLYGFSITFLSALFIEKLLQLKPKPVVNFKKLKVKLNFSIPLSIALSITVISAIIISNGYPLLLGDFAGYVQTYKFPNEYHTLYNKLLSDSDHNVLILPYINPIRYDDLRLQGLDPLIIDTPTMIFPTILGNRLSSTLGVSTWLLSSMQENMTHNLGKLLSGFGIKYVILRNDFVSNYPNYTPLGLLQNFREKWYAPLEPLLDEQTDMKMVSQTPQFKVYENLNNATKIFTPSTSVGGLTDFNSLLSVSNLSSLSNVALYQSISDTDSFVFLDGKAETNMTANNFEPIGKYANTFDPQVGWTNNILSFGYDHILASRTNEGLFSASPYSKVSFELPAKYNNKHVDIWVKALAWNQGGKINIQINGEEYPLSLFSADRSFRLFKIFEGESQAPHHILIENIRGQNYVEGFYVSGNESQQLNATHKIFLNNEGNRMEVNLIANSKFSTPSNVSGLPLYWYDFLNSCRKAFTCKINSTDGWDDKLSFQASTKKPHNLIDKWSRIYGQPIDVNAKEKYQLLTHMKLNAPTIQSHIALEGLNETSKQWHQLTQCPHGTNGPLEWQEFSCTITIPDNITKIRPILNAGWSSDSQAVARSWFDSLYINKIKPENQSSIIGEIKNLILAKFPNNKSSSIPVTTTTIKDYYKVNPTVWNLRVSTLKPTTIGFAEPYDPAWEATVYKNGKEIDKIKSVPLYGAINAFQIKEVGELDVVLKFERQSWYEIGFVISGATLAFCIFYIVYDYYMNRNRITKSIT